MTTTTCHGGPPPPGIAAATGPAPVEVILQSHQRSAAFGLREDDEPDLALPARAMLRDVLDENRFLFQHAAPVMETLYEQIANTHSMVLLTSASGMVLHTLGDSDFLERAARVALTTGADWSEQSKGTNAIGTALSEQYPLTVHGDQHYLNANKFLTCSCAPIFDPHGQVIGALDVTGDQRSYHQHTLALVRMSAQMIENHMFADVFPDAVRVHFHTRPEFLGTLVESIAVFTPDGRFLSANRSAQFQIGLSLSALKAHTFSSLFGIPISSLIDMFTGNSTAPRQLVMHNGVTVWCRASCKHPGLWPGAMAAARAAAASVEDISSRPASPATKPRQMSSLQYLDTGDAQMAAVIRKLRLVAGRNIPIMILGETGTGKDLLAQAIHRDSPRAGHPFVAVNCAAIPETLIESELFGYEEGAFTGARRKGMAGKILQANGGTLFLDEIGDMPRHLQARLLRVLQDRRISPLGAGKEIEVDIAVICATHKNLKELIARGEFREDLYYRLNGLVVRLPALRERTDFEAVVRRILASLCEGGHQVALSAEVMNLFRRYHWPGNVRQLHNLLRTAVILAGESATIEMTHLPDDFLEEVRQVPAAPPVPADTATVGALRAGGEAFTATARESLSLRHVTISAMAHMLRVHKGNVSAAAKALGVSRNTIYRKKDLLPPDVLGG